MLPFREISMRWCAGSRVKLHRLGTASCCPADAFPPSLTAKASQQSEGRHPGWCFSLVSFLRGQHTDLMAAGMGRSVAGWQEQDWCSG